MKRQAQIRLCKKHPKSGWRCPKCGKRNVAPFHYAEVWEYDEEEQDWIHSETCCHECAVEEGYIW